ncbi:putative tricarboxylic transport membrane protein [Desulfuromusa kysingii]|uniref:Putative tricarboxylic transport membrane protein n=1 Tax=Desulfuromusa kysingii TaxID=37625 RepID=A0A1H4DXI7_9BACT|nr:tripartite tricarboxylate transporter permease [Desulfuromusa kysingii]SEA77287.1 putative tricarboxylic transport membrane protein [Desulfuromusa kysingii]
MAAVEMDMVSGFIQGLELALLPINLGLILFGAFLGTMVGALPGLRSIHAVAVMLPIAYALELPVETTLIFLLTIYYGCEYGGRIETILSNGTKEEISTQLMATGISSFCGALISIFGLVFILSTLQLLQINLGPGEYFALVIFAFAALTFRAWARPLKTLLSTCIGLMLATIGIDSTTGVLRFTMGQPELYDGIEFTTVILGLFVVSEIFILMDNTKHTPALSIHVDPVKIDWATISASRWTILRSGLVGFLIGILPGSGTIVASDVSEQLERQKSTHELTIKQKILIARETANNAAAGGTVAPLLALGIPGSGTGAILLGALLLYNITPGPNLMNQQTELVWGLIVAAAIGNLILLIFNLPLIDLFAKLNAIPSLLLTSCLLVLAFISCFSTQSSSISLLLMILVGLFGYLLQKWHYPLVPLLLGFVLGDLMENNLRRALAISGGDFQILFSSAVSKTFWLLSVLVILLSFFWQRWKEKKQ